MITITCPGLDELQKTLADKGKNLDKDYDVLLEELVTEARDNAKAGYEGAREFVHPDDFEMPSVEYEKVGECDYIVSAVGKEVSFYEFGAGYTTDNFGFASEMPYMVSPGSWSVGHAQQFTRYGRWYSPNGHYYNSIPPTRAMFNAAEVIKYRLSTGDFVRT